MVSFRWDEERRATQRAKLDAIYANVAAERGEPGDDF